MIATMVHESYYLRHGRLVHSSSFRCAYNLFREYDNTKLNSFFKGVLVKLAIPMHTTSDISCVGSIWLWVVSL